MILAGHRCTICNVPLGKGEHNIHHRLAVRTHPQFALIPANHQALCTKCHGLVEAAERAKRRLGCDAQGNPTGIDHPWNKGLRP